MKISPSLLIMLSLMPAQAQEYLWPTDAGRLLTSSFAESREDRFHAGVDVKTWGRVGYKVIAVRSGYISRIQVSPFGYGRVLYQTLDTGEIAVYGHLQKFAPAIQAAVERKQEARNRYSITLLPGKEDFPVKQGDLIGYTGESGVGYPHLHFELRDKASRPINPLSKGYTLRDHLAPVIQTISLTPLSAYSRVQGDLRPLLVQPRRIADGQYRVDELIRVQGMIGFGMEAYDQMEGAANEFGTFRNQLWMDEQELFHVQYDRFSYDENPQSNLDRDYRLLAWNKGYFYKLFRDYGNELSFYRSPDVYSGVVDFDEPVSSGAWFFSILETFGLDWRRPAGVKSLATGRHSFRLQAEDYWGNKSTVTGQLQAEEMHLPQRENYGLAAVDSIRIRMTSEYYDDYCRLEFIFSTEPQGFLTLEGQTSMLTKLKIPLERAGTNRYLCGWPLSSSQSGPIELQLWQEHESGRSLLTTQWLRHETVPKNSTQTVSAEDGLCKIQFRSGSLYKAIFVRIATRTTAANPRYDIVMPLYAVEPADVALADEVTVSIRPADTDTSLRGIGVYVKSRTKEQWRFLGRDRQREGYVSAGCNSLGTFALIRDLAPPRIIALSPAEGSQLTERTPSLSAQFKDEVSGIGREELLSLRLDGKKVIAEYDPEDEALRYRVKSPLAKGRHTLECQISDRCGNISRKTHSFWVK